MLPGFPSFTGFHFVCIGFYQVLPGFTGFYWVFLGFTLFVSDFSRFYRVLLGFHGFCQVSSGFTVFDWVELDFIWLYQAEIGGSSELVAAGAELWLFLPSFTEWTAAKPWDWSWYRTGHLDNRLFHWIVYSLKFFFYCRRLRPTGGARSGRPCAPLAPLACWAAVVAGAHFIHTLWDAFIGYYTSTETVSLTRRNEWFI